jgi:hypothetical protein
MILFCSVDVRGVGNPHHSRSGDRRYFLGRYICYFLGRYIPGWFEMMRSQTWRRMQPVKPLLVAACDDAQALQAAENPFVASFRCLPQGA